MGNEELQSLPYN